MKKLMFAVASICLFTATAYAQIQDIKLGAKAGLNFDNVSGISESKMKLGFNVGVLGEIFFAEQFSLQSEIIYSSQGYKLDKINSQVNLDYINFPFIFKYYIFDGLNIQAGPQLGCLVRESTKINGKDISNDNGKSNGNSIEIGLGLGLGYELPNGLFIDARYNLGLTKIYKNSEYNQKNQVIQASVGFKF